MKSFLVYLAGPITGLSYEGSTDWRAHAYQALNRMSYGRIETLSPMRHKEYLRGTGPILDTYENTVLSSQRGIFYRDKLDCTRADLVLVNMLGATRVSIGTVMEIAWANARDIPIVLVMEDEGALNGESNIHEHSMLREACGFRIASLSEAYRTVAKILLPDGAMQPEPVPVNLDIRHFDAPSLQAVA